MLSKIEYIIKIPAPLSILNIFLSIFHGELS